MTSHSALNVADLPTFGEDTRAPIWWGNFLLLLIETTMFGLALAAYFYVHINFTEWPPPRVDILPAILNPLPDVFIPTANVVVLLASCIPMIIADRASRKMNRNAVLFALLLCIAFGIGTIILRFYEFPALKFRWDDNAYGSAVWTLLGMHLLHLFVMTSELVILVAYLIIRPLDPKHAVDVSVTAVYWYWVVGIWIPLYAIIYWGPRVL
jgi:cytochrome c oxidase subunit 3